MKPEEIDRSLQITSKNNPLGPYDMMDQMVLDMVAFIEDNHVQERGLDPTPRDWT